MDSPIFLWLTETVLPMLINKSAEDPEPDEDEASHDAFLHKSESHKITLPRAPPPQKAMLYYPLPGVVRYLKWWLTVFCGSFGYFLHAYRIGQR